MTWWASEIAAHIETLSVTNYSYKPDDTTGNVFLDHMADEPHLAVMVMTQPGQPPEDQHFGYDAIGLQFTVRGSADATGREAAVLLADALWHALAGLYATDLPGGATLIKTIMEGSSPGGIGPDSAGRPEYTFNVILEVTAPTTNRPLG